jgi:hypothetical protein
MERREALITGVVLAVTSALIAMIVATGTGPSADLARSLTPAGDRDDPGTFDEPADPVGSDTLDEFVDEAIAFVEATRGQPYLTEPVVVALDDEEFVDRVDADLLDEFASNPEDVETLNALYRATGMIAADDTVDEVYRAFGAAGILGFYDPETDELVVRQVEELSLLTKSTIVHELTHAFDDQRFDLDRPEYEDRTDEIPWTFRAVAEGSASWVEGVWKDRLDATDRRSLAEEELNFADPSVFLSFELSFLLYELSPYEYGEPFVEHLVDGGGTAALDGVLAEPPATSEQVMEPPRFDAGELAVELSPPPADAEPLYEGSGGNALIAALFAGNGVFRPVEWGGDQMSVWVDGTQSCLRWDVRAESAPGLADLQTGFEEWADRVGSATVTVLDEATIRVDRCA